MADFKTIKKVSEVEPNYIMNIEMENGKVRTFRFFIPKMTAAQSTVIKVRAEKLMNSGSGHVSMETACDWEMTSVLKNILNVDDPNGLSPFEVATQYLSDDDQDKVVQNVYAIILGRKVEA